MSTLEVTTERADGVAVVTLDGEVSADNADQLRGAFGELLADGVHNFVVDLSGVIVIDGAGLAELVNFFKRVRIGPGDVRLCRFPTWVTVMFAMTRLNKVFDRFESREAAVASFAPAGSGSA
jgi:anti-sigma B factor antagonist